jgi:hypothetical protein
LTRPQRLDHGRTSAATPRAGAAFRVGRARGRPVLRRSGKASLVAARITGRSGAMKRPRRSLVKNAPALKKRDSPGSTPAFTGHITASSGSERGCCRSGRGLTRKRPRSVGGLKLEQLHSAGLQ